MKTVWFSILPLQLNDSLLFFTACCPDLQQLHCFSKYGATGMTTSNDLHVPWQVWTLVVVGSQFGQTIGIRFRSLLHWPPWRDKPLLYNSKIVKSRNALNIFTGSGNPAILSITLTRMAITLKDLGWNKHIFQVYTHTRLGLGTK